MDKKIILVGRGGSGKDFLRKVMVSRGFSYGVSHTSRPPREGEIEGEDYYFRDEKFFTDNKDIFLELQVFNDWYYGISRKEFESKDLFILTPSGIKSLPKDLREKSLVIYLNPETDIILERLKGRKDVDSVNRRFIADSMDFFDFTDYDVEIKNSDF